MKRSFMRSRNDAKLCLAAGPYLRRPPQTPQANGDESKPQTSNCPADLDRDRGAGMTAGILDFAQVPGGDRAAEVS